MDLERFEDELRELCLEPFLELAPLRSATGGGGRRGSG
jgi:hypothetical protein